MGWSQSEDQQCDSDKVLNSIQIRVVRMKRSSKLLEREWGNGFYLSDNSTATGKPCTRLVHSKSALSGGSTFETKNSTFDALIIKVQGEREWDLLQ